MLRILISGLTLAVLAGTARADVVVIGASRDNTLYESPTGALSNGAGEHFFAGKTGEGKIRRGLIRFDVAGALPPGSAITGVTFTLYMSKTQAGPQPVALRRVLKDWGEGASNAAGDEGAGAPASPGDATWLHTFYDQQFWTAPGGDFAPTPSATSMMDKVGHYTWSSAEMVADTQAWLDNPAANFGWALLGNESTFSTAKRFDSRENANPAYRPALEVKYVPEPAALWMLLWIVALGRGRASRHGAAVATHEEPRASARAAVPHRRTLRKREGRLRT